MRFLRLRSSLICLCFSCVPFSSVITMSKQQVIHSQTNACQFNYHTKIRDRFVCTQNHSQLSQRANFSFRSRDSKGDIHFVGEVDDSLILAKFFILNLQSNSFLHDYCRKLRTTLKIKREGQEDHKRYLLITFWVI